MINVYFKMFFVVGLFALLTGLIEKVYLDNIKREKEKTKEKRIVNEIITNAINLSQKAKNK